MSSAAGTGPVARGAGWARQRLRSLSDRTSLRVKLITAVLALVAIALAVISFTTISVLRSYLLQPYDNTLQGLANPAVNQVGHFLAGAPPVSQPQTALMWVPSGGNPQMVIWPTRQASGFNPLTSPSPPPTMPGPQVPDNSAWLAANNGHILTVPARSGGGSWRILVEAASYGNLSQPITGSVIVGVDATSVYSTVGQVTDLDLIVSGLLLLGILIVGIAAVRASLRPLTDIEQTAAAIAAGDLSRRIPDRDPRTEVGRLGRSLNTMLAQIETAFDARAASEVAARGSEERMRQFVADASHELRTPLTAIRGYAEYYRQRGGLGEISGEPPRPTLSNGSDATGHQAAEASAESPHIPVDARVPPAHVDPHPAEAAPGTEGPLGRADLDRIMQRVEQESSRMGVLVEDMLLLARLDQQRPLERRTVDMLTIAADAVNDARVVAPERNISLTVGSGAALLVVGDEARLRQVITNLMSNALNHTPEGTAIEVRVRSGSLDEWRRAAQAAGQAALAAAGRDAQPVPAVVLEVTDHGPGLTPYQAEHVFERFYRADQARTRKAGGAGLGLSIVAALVAAHGGSVWLESPPGSGATFRVAIPLAPEARHIEPDPDDGTDPDILDSHGSLCSGPAT